MPFTRQRHFHWQVIWGCDGAGIALVSGDSQRIGSAGVGFCLDGAVGGDAGDSRRHGAERIITLHALRQILPLDDAADCLLWADDEWANEESGRSGEGI